MNLGLSSEEASRRLKDHGPNTLPSPERKNFAQSLAAAAFEPMVLLLMVCTAVYVVVGDLGEGLFLGLSTAFVIGISIFQQLKAENALDALRNLSSPRALVVRDGIEKRLPASEVVPGDVIVLQEGDRIPADATALTANHLLADESLLTGESGSVKKSAGDKVFGSTLIVKGHGTAEVMATGPESEVGRIGKLLTPPTANATKLQHEIRTIVWILAAIGIVFCCAIATLYAISRHDWLNGALAGVSAAMALLPEEFPVVLTIFLAVGAWRLSRINVLTRNLTAVENLGSITALCVDKTGTLTLNSMTAKALAVAGEVFDLPPNSGDLPERFHQLLEFGTLASHRNPFDPMERAIRKALLQQLAGTEHVHDNWQLIEEYPLTEGLLATSCVWREGENSGYVVAAKGAPEAITSLCHLSKSDSDGIRRQAEVLALRGLRVLGVAKAQFHKPVLPARQDGFEFSFVGLLGFEDPIRPQVKQAVQECHSAGIRVVMITGDHPGTAMKIADEAGIDSRAGVLLGSEMEDLNEVLLKERIRSINVFARTRPEQKLRIVNALKESGETVAMTGDGVNDAPSLKWADVGIAMGGRGTDVAREAADLVILDDQFASIVNGIRRGRIIYSNIRRAMAFLFAVHVPIAGLALLPVIMNWPLILFPVHIALLELIIDPACTMVFEGRERFNLMSEPPRAANRRIFSVRDIAVSTLAGLIVCALVAAFTCYSVARGDDFKLTRTVTFFSLILANLGLIRIFLGFGETANPTPWYRRPVSWISALMLGACAAIWGIPSLRTIFGFTEPSLGLTALSGLIAAAAFALAALWYYANLDRHANS